MLEVKGQKSRSHLDSYVCGGKASTSTLEPRIPSSSCEQVFRICHDRIIIPAKAREYVFTGVGLSVCLSVTMITKNIVDGFVPNFMGRFLGEGKTKFLFRYDR